MDDPRCADPKPTPPGLLAHADQQLAGVHAMFDQYVEVARLAVPAHGETGAWALIANGMCDGRSAAEMGEECSLLITLVAAAAVRLAATPRLAEVLA